MEGTNSGMDYWNGMLDWNTGMAYKYNLPVNCILNTLHMYTLTQCTCLLKFRPFFLRQRHITVNFIRMCIYYALFGTW